MIENTGSTSWKPLVSRASPELERRQRSSSELARDDDDLG